MKTFIVTVFVILGLMVASAFGLGWILNTPRSWHNFSAQDWTAFSELYGALLGPLFSGFAFAGILWTIQLQRRELRETRKELAKAAEAQAAQVEVAQLSARLDASRALYEYYDALFREVLKGKFSRKAELFINIKSLRDTNLDLWSGLDEATLTEETADALYPAFLKGLKEARLNSAIEMHRVRDVLREKAQIASITMQSPGQTMAANAVMKSDEA